MAWHGAGESIVVDDDWTGYSRAVVALLSDVSILQDRGIAGNYRDNRSGKS